jgi:hypothetical protein
MSTGAIVAIIVVVIVVAAILAAAPLMRRNRLRRRFGPEYDRAVAETGSRRAAETELMEREKRVKNLDLRPLDPAAAQRFENEWQTLQEQFVDAPTRTVKNAQTLVAEVLSFQGYPAEDGRQMLADLSVDHSGALEPFRAAQELSGRASTGNATTEDLRQALVNYRAVVQDLLGDASGGNGTTANGAAVDGAPTTTTASAADER